MFLSSKCSNQVLKGHRRSKLLNVETAKTIRMEGKRNVQETTGSEVSRRSDPDGEVYVQCFERQIKLFATRDVTILEMWVLILIPGKTIQPM